jgi:hypothetical protein
MSVSKNRSTADAKALEARVRELEDRLSAECAAKEAERAAKIRHVTEHLRLAIRQMAKRGQNADAAKAREGLRNPLLAAIDAELRVHRKAKRSLSEALASMLESEPDDFSVTRVGDDVYVFDGGHLGKRSAGKNAVANWWTAAGKPAPRLRRKSG